MVAGLAVTTWLLAFGLLAWRPPLGNFFVEAHDVGPLPGVDAVFCGVAATAAALPLLLRRLPWRPIWRDLAGLTLVALIAEGALFHAEWYLLGGSLTSFLQSSRLEGVAELLWQVKALLVALGPFLMVLAVDPARRPPRSPLQLGLRVTGAAALLGLLLTASANANFESALKCNWGQGSTTFVLFCTFPALLSALALLMLSQRRAWRSQPLPQ